MDVTFRSALIEHSFFPITTSWGQRRIKSDCIELYEKTTLLLLLYDLNKHFARGLMVFI